MEQMQEKKMTSTADRPLRRKERELTEEQAYEVLDATDHAALATCDLENNPYCVPVSPAREGQVLYFHATGWKGGRKEDNMLMNPKVSLCFVAKAFSLPEWFSVDFASTVVKGIASKVEDPEERLHAIDLILKRHAPKNSPIRNDAQIKERFPKAVIWKVKIESISGKARGAKKWEKDKSIHEVQDMGPSAWLVGLPF